MFDRKIRIEETRWYWTI